MGSKFGTWSIGQSIHGLHIAASFEFRISAENIYRFSDMGLRDVRRPAVNGRDGVLLACPAASLGGISE